MIALVSLGLGVTAQAQLLTPGDTRYLVLNQTPVAALGTQPTVTATTSVTGSVWRDIPGLTSTIKITKPYKTFDVIGTLHIPLVSPFAFPDLASVANRKIKWRFLLNNKVVGGDNIQTVAPFSLRNLKAGTYTFKAQFQSLDGTPVGIGGVDLTATLLLRK